MDERTDTRTDLADNPTAGTPGSHDEHVAAAENTGGQDAASTRTEPTSTQEDAPAIGTFITEGVSAVREMSAARRALGDARDRLDNLLDLIDEQEQALDRRRDIELNYTRIVTEQTAARDNASQRANTARNAAEAARSEFERLDRQLKETKAADDKTERHLRDAYDDAHGAEELAAKALARAEKRLREAREALDAATKSRDDSTAAAQKRIDDVSMRIHKLESELAELERNPSTNTAEYATRRRDLMQAVNEAGAQLAAAREALPAAIDAATSSVADAMREAADAEQPIERLESAHQAAQDAAERARDELDDARDDADERQRDLREKVSACKKELDELERTAATAQTEADAAASLLAEAEDVHAHPEATEQLAAELDRNYHERDAQQQAVNQLAENERGVRQRTRGKRLSFIAALIAAALVVIAIVAVAVVGIGK